MGTIAVLAVIILLCALGIRGLVREKKSGGRCECIGDCSKCKIQCRKNENYYGIQKKSESQSYTE